MSYTRFLDPAQDYSVSNAEIKICNKLKHDERCLSMLTQKEFCLLSTKPDFYFPDVNLAVYIDGEQIHRKREAKDLELRELLKKRYGCTVRSFSYRAPITKKRLAEIVSEIRDDVLGLRRMRT